MERNDVLRHRLTDALMQRLGAFLDAAGPLGVNDVLQAVAELLVEVTVTSTREYPDLMRPGGIDDLLRAIKAAIEAELSLH